MDKAHKVESISFSGTTMLLRVDGKDYQIDITGQSQRLAAATPKQRQNFVVSPSGYGIHPPSQEATVSRPWRNVGVLRPVRRSFSEVGSLGGGGMELRRVTPYRRCHGLLPVGLHWPELDEDLSVDGLIGIRHQSPFGETAEENSQKREMMATAS
jgi:hypothetical protein